METIQARLINWGKWASNATGTGYHGTLAEYKPEFTFDSAQLEDAALIDRAIASTRDIDEVMPFLLYQYFANGKSVRTIHGDWIGTFTKAKSQGWCGSKPPGETKIRQLIDMAAYGCEMYLRGLRDAA